MPISNKGTSLKVETNIGGNIYHDETVRDVYYRHNLQRSTQREAGTHPMDMKTYGHPNSAPEVEEYEMPAEMEKAINNDLADKGVKPKRKRNKKTTTITEQTND